MQVQASVKVLLKVETENDGERLFVSACESELKLPFNVILERIIRPQVVRFIDASAIQGATEKEIRRVMRKSA